MGWDLSLIEFFLFKFLLHILRERKMHIQKIQWQCLLKRLAAVPITDSESLKFLLYFSYILVVGALKITFKYWKSL